MINEKDFIFDNRLPNCGIECEGDREEVRIGDYNYEIDLSGNVYFKTKCNLYRLNNEAISFKKDGLTGLLDNNGKVIIPPKYKHIYTPLGGGDCYSVCCHNWGLIDKNGNWKAPLFYQGEFEYIGENYYRAYSKKGDGVIDDTGKTILPFIYYDTSIYFWNEEKDKFTAFKNDIEKYGIVNTKNETIIPFEYGYIDICFKSGRYKNCCLASKNDKFGIINDKNEVIIPFEYDDITKLSDETFLVTKDNNYSITDDKFNKIRNVGFNMAIPYEDITDDYFVACINSENGKHGLIDKYGNLIIDLKYNDLNLIDNSNKNGELYIWAQNEQGKCGIIDVNENIIVPFEYDCQYGLRIEKDYTVVLVKDKKYGIVNIKDNAIITDFVFDYIDTFDDRQTTMAKYNGKWGVINKKGEALKYDLENKKDLDDLKYDVYSDVRQKQQEESFKYWTDYVEEEYPSLIHQINNEPLLKSNKLKITPNIWGVYFGLFFKIESDYGDSYIELPFHENQVNHLLLWLENIVIEKYHKNYLLLWGDGPHTNYFLSEIDKENKDLIKFVHITDSIYGGIYVEEHKCYCQAQVYPATVQEHEFEAMAIRNAFTIDKKTFIKEFYNAYKKIVDIDVSKLEGNIYKDEISAIRKNSSLIEHYLNIKK